MPRSEGLTGDRPRACIRRLVHQPRQIYASAADRRSGRRWSRRHRHPWLTSIVLAGAAGVALAASEMLRSLG
jgi:hypothetical protein